MKTTLYLAFRTTKHDWLHVLLCRWLTRWSCSRNVFNSRNQTITNNISLFSNTLHIVYTYIVSCKVILEYIRSLCRLPYYVRIICYRFITISFDFFKDVSYTRHIVIKLKVSRWLTNYQSYFTNLIFSFIAIKSINR